MRRGISRAALAVAVTLIVLAGANVMSAQEGGRFSVVVQDSEATIVPAGLFAELAPNVQGIEDAPVYRDGERVGQAATIVTFVRTDQADVIGIIECSVELPEGDLFFNGSFHLADMAQGAVVPVVGGTGEYAGSVGTVTMKTGDDGRATILEFDIG